MFALAFAAMVLSSDGSTTLESYRADSLELRYSFWSGAEVYRGGHEVSIGFAGGDADKAFRGSLRALEIMESYRGARIAGTLLAVVGLAGLVAEIIAVLAVPSMFATPVGLTPAFYGWLIPSAAVALTGAAVIEIAPMYLSRAVVAYNEELALRMMKEASSKPAAVTLRVGGAF